MIWYIVIIVAFIGLMRPPREPNCIVIKPPRSTSEKDKSKDIDSEKEFWDKFL